MSSYDNSISLVSKESFNMFHSIIRHIKEEFQNRVTIPTAKDGTRVPDQTGLICV